MHGFYGTNDPKVKISGSEKPFFTMKRNQSEIIKVSTVRVNRRYYIAQKDKNDRKTLEVWNVSVPWMEKVVIVVVRSREGIRL